MSERYKAQFSGEKAETGITIIIPLFRQPNFLIQCLYGLNKNSYFHNRIIVVWSSEKIEEHITLARSSALLSQINGWDFVVDQAGTRWRKYTLTDDMARDYEGVYSNVEFYNVTEEVLAFHTEHGKYFDARDAAYKNNYGIHLTDSKYCVPYFDADFFVGKDWDKYLVEAMELPRPEHMAAVPCHVQPYHIQSDIFSHLNQSKMYDPWMDMREKICNVLIMGALDKNCHVTEQEWQGFQDRYKRNAVRIEQCGIRDRLHFTPIMFRTQELKEHLQGYDYEGCACELRIDDRAGQMGFMKVNHQSSFILHKGWIKGLV